MAQSNPLLISLSTLFFDPDGEIMYVEGNRGIYEWKLRAREGLEWWLGEEHDA